MWALKTVPIAAHVISAARSQKIRREIQPRHSIIATTAATQVAMVTATPLVRCSCIRSARRASRETVALACKPVSIAISAVAAAATVITCVANSKPRVRIRRQSQEPRGGNEDDRRMDEEWMNVRKTVEESHTGFLRSGLGDFGWPVRNFDTELPRVEPRPTELHRPTSNDAADGSPAEKAIQDIETNVPPGSTH